MNDNDNYYDRIVIKNKKICIFEQHHYALLPWSEVKKQNKNEEIILISLDHHTDTHTPFLYYAYYNKVTPEKLLKEIDINSSQSIMNAINKLKNDEHIHTAIDSDIIKKALIIAHEKYSCFPKSNEEKKWREQWRFFEKETEIFLKFLSVDNKTDFETILRSYFSED
ncbi:MAG: UPF0489 family protein, partial [Oscillospiraceae bacterium]|nr:UPF0489 family protein [Oscillospiraceae bacterium]